MKKVIVIILIISILAGLLMVGVSAYSNTSNIAPVTAMQYSYDHTLQASHRTNGYDYNYVSGVMYSTPLGIIPTVRADYQYDFTANQTGTYLITHKFSANTEFTWYKLSVIDSGGNSIYSYKGSNTRYGNLTHNIGTTLNNGSQYTLKISVAKEAIDAENPASYTMNFGLDYSASGTTTDFDTNNTPLSNAYLTYDHTDSDGKAWYLYHGFKYQSRTGSSTAYPVNTDSSLSWTNTNTGTYSTSSINLVFFEMPINGIIVPRTGDWEIYLSVNYAASAKTVDPSYLTKWGACNSSSTVTGYNPYFWSAETSTTYPYVARVNPSYVPTYYFEEGTPFTKTTGFYGTSNEYFKIWQFAGTTIQVEDLRMWFVCTPSYPSHDYDGLPDGTTVTDTEVDINNLIVYDTDHYTVELPDVNNDFSTHVVNNYYYQGDTYVYEGTTDTGIDFTIQFTDNSVVYYIDDHSVINNYVITYNNYDGDGTENDNPLDDDNHDPGDGPTNDPFNLWNWLMELLASLLEGIFEAIKSVIVGVFNAIIGFLGNAVQNITDFFDVFNPSSGALDFFKEGSGFEWSTP